MTKYLTKKIIDFANLVKFAHTIFALPFALVGFSLGFRDVGKGFSWQTLLLVLFCMFTARNVAMSFNRIADRKYDKLNPRTASREIPAQVIEVRAAVWFAVINSLIFIVATYYINILCFFLSPVALSVILGYSFTKRFTWFCHLVLGLGLALAPIGAYLAVTGSFAVAPILFSFGVLCWVSGFDIIYALQDEDFDKENRLYSIPAWLGTRKSLRFSMVLHVACIMFFVVAGVMAHLGYIYYIGTTIFSVLILLQHSKVSSNDLSKVNQVFFLFNGIASIVFAVFAVIDVFCYKF
ncbi:MAG: UbiA-like polyprenyltransferase [Bacteroidota bacterium]